MVENLDEIKKKIQIESPPPLKFENHHLSFNFDDIFFKHLCFFVSWKLGLNWKHLQKGPDPSPPQNVKIDYPIFMKLSMKNIYLNVSWKLRQNVKNLHMDVHMHKWRFQNLHSLSDFDEILYETYLLEY